MTNRTIIFLMAVMTSVVAEDYNLNKLPPSMPVGGKCLDGTPAGFYIREGVNLNPSLFVIYLQGGGYCSNKRDCDRRVKSGLGSSNYWEAQLRNKDTIKGVLNQKCDENPDFCEATTVYVPYCTGDVHIGTRMIASEDTWGYTFDGHYNFVAIIDRLIANHGLGNATQVLLTGGSAGAIGVFHHVDYLADRLPSAVVKGAPIAGWYLPGAHHTDPSPMYMYSDYQHFAAGAHGNDYEDPFQKNIWGSNENLPQDCITDFGENFLACTTLHNRYRYIKSPVYVIQAQYDPKHIFDIGGAPARPATSSEYDSTKAYIEMIGNATRASLGQIISNDTYALKPHPDGLFEASCLHHGLPLGLTINGLHWIALLHDWFFQKNDLQDYHQLVETCSYESGEMKLPCNIIDNCRIDGNKISAPPSPSSSSPSSTSINPNEDTPSPTTTINPKEEQCRSNLESKGCTYPSSQSEQSCLKCAQRNRRFLVKNGCTVDIARKACNEITQQLFPFFINIEYYESPYELNEEEWNMDNWEKDQGQWYTQWPYITGFTLTGGILVIAALLTAKKITKRNTYTTEG